jgi:hypothetical protein
MGKHIRRQAADAMEIFAHVFLGGPQRDLNWTATRCTGAPRLRCEACIIAELWL